MADVDLAIIGGGINGAGIARDAAGRGLRVVLVEQGDLAAGTSSASSKLIHGGLRYLEHGALRLVRAALSERDVLLRMAPHLIRPLRFVLPLDSRYRSPALLRLGLFIYDKIGCRELLPPTRSVDPAVDATGVPLRRHFHRGYEYSDCVADDARLVVLNAVDAAERGAAIRTRTRCVRAERGDTWRLILNARGVREVVTARVLINAAGAWADIVAETVLRQKPSGRLRLDKGSHIVVPRLYEHDRAYILQAPDGRVVFTIPFQRDFTLIGTTEQSFSGDPAIVVPTEAEIDYLCGVVSSYFRATIVTADTVWGLCGRALYDDGASKPQDVGRDYALVLDAAAAAAPLLSVYGGKLTTFRRLAEDALSALARYLPRTRRWTAGSTLPGGDFACDGIAALVERTLRQWPFLRKEHAERLVGAYDRILQGRKADGGSRRPAGRRSDRRRGALSDRPRSGADRRRCALAPVEARPAIFAERACRLGAVHGRRGAAGMIRRAAAGLERRLAERSPRCRATAPLLT
jgi:glycerol-3-phosphate dehydrogenase